MSRRTLTAAVLAVAVTAVAIPGLSTAAPDTVKLTTKLTGKAEVPGPGSKNGKGDITVKVTPSKRKVCFVLDVKNLDPIHAGHIHKGAEGVAGPIKVTLFEDDTGLDGDGAYDGCVKQVKKKLLKKIVKNPANYYVNIHTGDFPDGAIRGQLAQTIVG